ncbi:MAG: hypothetical protein CFE37_07885 [Alphaproteobacteria bacterium PA4]|nr:MAG: hypothetical protein CFE37_07885 [Alphaproteobacteria bacterium PA4]
MEPHIPEPSWRKPVGVLGLLAYLVLYAGLVASFAATLSALPTVLMIVAYVVAGLAWTLPLKPLFLWMNTGRWTLRK